MNNKQFLCRAVTAILLLFSSPALAVLDLDQELLIIPDTHNEKPYIWQVARNPRGYDLNLGSSTSGGYILQINRGTGIALSNLHLFITDYDLHTFAHLRPAQNPDGSFSFQFSPVRAGKYRFEIVFRSESGWVTLRKDLNLSGSGKEEAAYDRDYSASVKPIPKNSFADHVTTFLYDLAYKGAPLSDLEKMDGVDMILASWDEDLRGFIFATPSQNLGGPKVAISVVFERSGKHAVFSVFRHRGMTQTVEFSLNVRLEPNIDPDAIQNLKPAD